MKKILLVLVIIVLTELISSNSYAQKNEYKLDSYYSSMHGLPEKISDLFESKDPFTGEVKYSSDVLSEFNNVVFIRYKNKKIKEDYIFLRVYGHTVSVFEKGVFILLDNGTKIVRKNERVDCDVNTGAENGYLYTSFFKLNQQEKNLLKKHKIKIIRLYIYDFELEHNYSEWMLWTSKIIFK